MGLLEAKAACCPEFEADPKVDYYSWAGFDGVEYYALQRWGVCAYCGERVEEE
jgi:hypothetical protein